jgi:hypothetical protein
VTVRWLSSSQLTLSLPSIFFVPEVICTERDVQRPGTNVLCMAGLTVSESSLSFVRTDSGPFRQEQAKRVAIRSSGRTIRRAGGDGRYNIIASDSIEKRAE